MSTRDTRIGRPPRDRDSPRTPLVYVLYVFYGALSLAFCSPLLTRPAGLGHFDWDQHFFYYAQVLKNVMEYGRPPFWSPWYCGGNVLWQNPQTALFSPAYPLASLMSLALAMKVNIVVHYWIGFVGMHRLLTRVMGLAFLPLVVYLASVFTLGGALVLHLAVGHSVFLPAFYLPLLVYFFFCALNTGAVRPVLYAAALLALMVYNGGLHIVPMVLVALGIFSACAAVGRRTWRPILMTVLLGVAGCAYAAPKLVPVSLFVNGDRFWDTRNPIERPDRMTAEMMLRAYGDSSQNLGSRFATVQRHSWWEYGNYVGPVAILLIVSSLVWVLVSRAVPDRGFVLPLALTSVALLVLSAGELSAFSPASLLGRVPFFSQFRIPSRYTIPFVLFGTLTAAGVARAFIERITTRGGRDALAVVCALAVVQLALVNRAQFQNVFSVPPFDTNFHFLRGSGELVTDPDISPWTGGSPMLRALMKDRAVFYCYESLQLTRVASTGPLVYSSGTSTISSIVFTPNRIQFAVLGGAEPSKVYLNQNTAPGWRSSAGPVLIDPRDGGKLYVQLSAGQTGKFSFSFVPPGLIAGVIVLLVSVVLSALAWRRHLPQDPGTAW